MLQIMCQCASLQSTMIGIRAGACLVEKKERGNAQWTMLTLVQANAWIVPIPVHANAWIVPTHSRPDQ